MKGQEPFVSHTLIIGFASVILVIVAVSLVTVHNDYSDFIIESSTSKICSDLRTAVSEIVSNDLLEGNILLHLPAKIGDKNYDLSGNLDIVKIHWENQEKDCKLGYDVNMDGNANGGSILLDYTGVNIVLEGL